MIIYIIYSSMHVTEHRYINSIVFSNIYRFGWVQVFNFIF